MCSNRVLNSGKNSRLVFFGTIGKRVLVLSARTTTRCDPNTTAALTLTSVACSIEYLFRRGARQFEWNVPSFPDGSRHFNSFCWRLLFVFGAWLALGGAKGCRSILTSPIQVYFGIAHPTLALVMT